MKTRRFLYMCATSWSHELGNADVRLFGSAKEMRTRALACWKECGAVRLHVTSVEVVNERKKRNP